MAKQGKRVLRARKPAASRDDDSLLIRSAESLGRVIGSLKRQIRSGSKRVSSITDDAIAVLPEMPRMKDLAGNASRSRRTATRAGKTKRRTRKAPSRKAAALKK